MSAESMASPTIGTDSDQNAAPTKERRSWTLQENAMVVEVILAGVRWLVFPLFLTIGSFNHVATGPWDTTLD